MDEAILTKLGVSSVVELLNLDPQQLVKVFDPLTGEEMVEVLEAIRSEPRAILEILVESEDGYATYTPTTLTIMANHSFGASAQYKLRDPKVLLDGKISGISWRYPVVEGDTTLATLLASLVNQAVYALELVVGEAERRDELPSQLREERRKEKARDLIIRSD